MAVNKDFVVKNGLQVGANTSIEGSITTVDLIQFDTTASATITTGALAWNANTATLDIGVANTTIQLGQVTTLDTLTVTNTANITSLTANTFIVTSVALPNGWTITESSGDIYFAMSGSNKMKLYADGSLDIAGSLNTDATIS